MSKYGGNNRIDFGVHFNTDKSSLEDVKKSLQELSKLPLINYKGSSTELLKLKEMVGDIGNLLDSSFNAKLNTINVDKFNESLNKSKYSLQEIYNEFSKAGPVGQKAFSQMSTAVLTTNLQLKQTHSLINSMGRTMMNTVKWGIASSIMNNFTQSISQAFQYVKSLDSALTDIRIVTGDSTEQMAKFADQANRAAQELGRSTMDYSKAALTFYQQGLSDEDVAARTEATLKAQNITGAGEQMADYLTAVWNGYKVANEEAELYVDKLAAVADSSASNMSQLAVAMSKVASTANLLGVPVDSLNAQIATIVATTRQAPETVGNALKTIYARINDIKTGSDDAEVSLGNYTSQMAQLGINVLDASGNLRDTGDVIEEIGGKWENLSREQQIYLARTMAGQRQYNNLLALFENWGKYTDLVTVSMDAQGTTMEKNSRYMDSLAAHMEQLGAAGQRVKTAMIDSDSFKNLIDLGTNLTNLFANFIESIGGGGNALLALGGIATQVFSGIISREINNIIVNQQRVKDNLNQLNADIQMTEKYGKIQGLSDEAIKQTLELKQGIQEYYGLVNAEQINAYNNLVKESAQLRTKAEEYKRLYDIASEAQGVLDSGKAFEINGQAYESLETYKKGLQQIKSTIIELPTALNSISSSSNALKNFAYEIKDNIGEKLFTQFSGETGLDVFLSKVNLGSSDLSSMKTALIGVIEQIQKIDPSKAAQLEQLWNKNVEAADRARMAAKQYLKEIQQLSNVKAFTQMIGAIGRFAAGLNSLLNITKIIKNESLSTGEKTLQVISAITMGLGMITSGLSGLKPILIKIVSSLTELNAGTIGVKGLSAALFEAEMSASGFAVALSSALLPILAIVTAIGAVIAILSAADKAYNKNANAAKRATQQMNQAKESFEEVKTSVDELKTSIETISNAQNSLDTLIVGTEEWKQALQECNSTVLELIRNYPTLATYVSNVNGQLRLSEEGQKEALKLANQQLETFNQAYLTTAQNAREANITSAATNLGRGLNSRIGIGGTEHKLDVSSDNVLKIANALIEVDQGVSKFDASSQKLSEYIAQETQINQKIVEAVLSSQQELQALKQAINENTTATKLANQAYASQLMQNTDYYKNASEEDQQVLNTLGAGIIQKATDQWIDRLEKPLNAQDASKQEWSADVLAEMTKILGKTVKWDDNSIRNGKGSTVEGRDLAFKIEGQNEAKIYSAEYVASIMATKEALEQLGTSANDANDILQTIAYSKLGEGISSGLKGFITGEGFGSLSQDELNQLQGIKLDSLFNEEQIDILEQAMGKTINQLQTDFDNMANDANKNFEQVFYGLPRSAEKAFKEIQPSLKDLSFNAQQNIANILGKGFETGGTVGLQQIKSILKSVKPEDLNAFGQALNNLNWEDENSISKFNEVIKEQGLDIDTTSEQWLSFTNYLHTVISTTHSAIDAFDKLRNSLQGIQSLKDLKAGDVLSDEDYQELIEKNKKLADLFRITTDGYMFIGSQQQATQMLKAQADTAIEDFHKMRDAAAQIADNKKIAQLSNFSFDEEKVSGGNMASSLQYEDGFNNALATLGISEEAFYEAADWLKRHQGEQIDNLTKKEQEALDANQAFIQNAFDQITNLQSGFNNGDFQDDQLRTLTASTADSLQALRDFYYNRQILAEDYNDFREAMLNKEIERLGITREEYDNTTEVVKEQLENVSDSFNNLNEQAQQVEIDQLTSAVIQAGQALDEIGAITEDTLDELEGLSELELGSNDQFVKLKENLQTIFDTDIDTSFIQQHFDLIRRLAEGDITALNDLQLALGQQFIADIQPQVNEEGAQTELNAFSDYLNNFNFDDLQVGVSLDDAGFFEMLGELAAAAGLSADQINELLANIGFEPQVTEQTIPFNEINKSEHGNDYQYTWTDPVTGQTQQIFLTSDQYDQAQSDGQITIPIINGKKIKYKGGSGMGNFARPNYARQAAPKSKGSGGGKKGSGSSGKPSIAKKNETKIDTKQKTQENDPYYKVNKSIEKQSKLLDDIKDQEKQLVNKDRLKNLQSQNKEIEKQLGNYQEYLSISKNVAAENSTANLRKRLQDTFGSNIGFDAEGNIADMNKVQRAAVNSYNKAATQAENTFKKVQDQYNNWILHTWNTYSKDQQEAHQKDKEAWDEKIKNAETAAKDAISAAEEEYKKKTDLIKKYQDQLKKDKEMHEKYIEQLRQIIENNIEASKIKVDLALDTGQLERDWLEFENKFIKKLDDKDILGQAAANAKELMSYFDSEEIAKTNKQIEDLYKDLNNIQNGGFSNIYGVDEEYYNGLTEAEKESLRTWGEGQLQKRLQELQEQQQESLMKMQDIINDIKDQYLDMIDEAKDQMDDHIDQYERVNDIIEHNVKLTEMLYGDKGYQTLDKYYQMQKDNNMSTLQTLKAQEAYWREQMNHEVVGSEAWKKFKENLDDAIDAVNSKLEDMLDNLAKEFENKMNAAVDRINNRLTSGLGTNYLDEQWDYLNNYDDYFLDTYNATTGIEDVTRAYQQAIDDAAANPKQQQKLNKLMNDQLKILKEKDKLTEYDLERAKSMLEVEKARMALEDARNNKTKMRLRRDSQGNYTYQYVADEQKLGELQQALADAQNDLYNTDKEHYKENLNTLYDTYKEYIEKMKDLTAEYNATQDEEERKRIQNRMDLLKESYSKMYEGLTEDNKYNIQYLAESFSTGMNLDFSGLTTEEQWEVLKENVPWAQSNIQALADSIVAEGGLLPATKDLVKELGDAIVQYDADVQHILETGGTSLATISGVLDENGIPLDQNITDAQRMVEYNNQLVNATMQGVEEMQTLLSTVDEYWSKQMENIQKYVTTLQNSYDTLQKLNDSTLTSDKIDVVDTQTSSTTDAVSDLAFTGDLKSDTNMLQEKLNSLMLEYKEFLASMGAAVFDTGGYTGIWGGDDGKIALLHQKELVLNPTDTENILAAVTAVRDATANMNITSQLDNLGNSTSNLLRNLLENSTLLDQNVHIDANFPNVNNHTQIEEAFNNLVNMAAMRASGYRD